MHITISLIEKLLTINYFLLNKFHQILFEGYLF